MVFKPFHFPGNVITFLKHFGWIIVLEIYTKYLDVLNLNKRDVYFNLLQEFYIRKKLIK